jgi:16S rRNA (guanine966-N2)-methyltransferase
MHSNKGNRSAGAGALRIVGGKYRSRMLRVPARPGLRPTPDRVRETLFNWLGQDLEGLACLDLFAGSGALGFEAASRGAARVVLVEKDRAVLAELERSRAALGASQVEIAGGDAHAFLAGRGQRVSDVVFSTRRSGRMPCRRSSRNCRSCLQPQARVYVESDEPIAVAPPWTELKRARAGQVSYQLLRWDGHDQSGVPGNV